MSVIWINLLINLITLWPHLGWKCGQTVRWTDVGRKAPAAVLLHEITEKNTVRKCMLLPLCVHAVGEQAERKLIRSDQSHVHNKASGAALTLLCVLWSGDAHSWSHKLISSRRGCSSSKNNNASRTPSSNWKSESTTVLILLQELSYIQTFGSFFMTSCNLIPFIPFIQ